MESILGYLQQDLDMGPDQGPNVDPPLIAEQSDIVLPLRVPFSVVLQLYLRWSRNEVSDEAVREQHGGQWVEAFHLRSSSGLAVLDFFWTLWQHGMWMSRCSRACKVKG